MPAATTTQVEFSRPSAIATSVILLAAVAVVFFPGGESYQMANQAAWIMGLGLALGLAFVIPASISLMMLPSAW